MYKKIMQQIDVLCVPPTNYATVNYATQLNILWNRVLKSKGRAKNIILLVWFIFHLGLSLLLTPVCFILHLMGYRFLSIDLKQIGSILWLDLYLRENLTRAHPTKKNKIIVARSHHADANPYAFNLYEPYVTFVFSPFLRFLLYPFFVNIFFQTRVSQYEHTYPMRKNIDHNEPSKVQAIFQHYSKQSEHPLCRLTPDEIARGKTELSAIMSFDRPFVTLHVRDSGFYKEQHASLRNGSVQSCESAIEYLIQQGYTVVRAGTGSAEPIDTMLERFKPHLIDYARSPLRSDFLDCFLATVCEFYLGGSSGYTYLPAVFETPSCYVDFYNPMLVLGFGKKDLASFKKIRRIGDNSLIPFHDIVREPFTRNLSQKELQDMGATCVSNTPEEILETVKEFLSHTADKLNNVQIISKQQMPVWNYCYQAQGNFSKAILKEYGIA